MCILCYFFYCCCWCFNFCSHLNIPKIKILYYKEFGIHILVWNIPKLGEACYSLLKNIYLKKNLKNNNNILTITGRRYLMEKKGKSIAQWIISKWGWGSFQSWLLWNSNLYQNAGNIEEGQQIFTKWKKNEWLKYA